MGNSNPKQTSELDSFGHCEDEMVKAGLGANGFSVNGRFTASRSIHGLRAGKILPGKALSNVFRFTRNNTAYNRKRRLVSLLFGFSAICFDLVAGPTRLELATSGVTGRRSNQLNYDPT
jgi:hypothetical protein